MGFGFTIIDWWKGVVGGCNKCVIEKRGKLRVVFVRRVQNVSNTPVFKFVNFGVKVPFSVVRPGAS